MDDGSYHVLAYALQSVYDLGQQNSSVISGMTAPRDSLLHQREP